MHTIEEIPQLPGRPRKPWPSYLLETMLAIGGSLVITGLIAVFHLYPAIPNISIIYLLLILLLASIYGRYASLLASVASFLLIDFFLIPPLYSLSIFGWQQWLALSVFLITALITSQLAVMARQSVEQARLREREAWILYESGRVINMTANLNEQLESIALALVRVFAAWGVRECAILLPDEQGTLHLKADAPIRIEPFALSEQELTAAQAAIAAGTIQEVQKAGSGAERSLLRLVPLKVAGRTLGVLALRLERGVSWFATEWAMLETQKHPTPDSIFFWTFLDEAVMKIEQAGLRKKFAVEKDESTS
jgi:two-component system sensor histidine kinase KdpD